MKYFPKISKILTATVLTLHLPTANATGISESAKEAIARNKATADSWAERLVIVDFDRAFQSVVQNLDAVDKSHATFLRFLSAKSELEQKFTDFSLLDVKTLDLTAQGFDKLRSQYEDLVRERFDLSWVPPQVAERYGFLGPMLQELVERYKNSCAAGRSDFKYDPNIPPEPAPPPYHFEVMANFNGPYPTESYRGLNYNRHHETRKGIITVSAAVTSTTGSILATSGAIAPYTYVFPVASAVLVTALAVEHFENMAEANQIAAEIAAAEAYKFHHTKRDDYVAEKYRELCKERITRLERVANIVSQLEASGPEAEKLITEAKSREAEMGAFQKTLFLARNAQCRLNLLAVATRNGCATAQTDAETRKKAFCQKSPDGSVDLTEPFKDCHLKTVQNGTYEGADADRKLISEVTPAKVEALTAHKLVQLLGTSRTNFLNAVATANWNAIDAAKERSFATLLRFISLARQMAKTGQLDGTRAITTSLARAQAYDKLRARFVDLVGLAIKVTFAHAPMSSYSKEMAKLSKDFMVFFDADRLDLNAQDLDVSIRKLQGIMKNAL